MGSILICSSATVRKFELKFEFVEKNHSGEEKQLLGKNLCVLCFANVKNVVFLPCNHVTLCTVCCKDKLSISLNTNFKQNKRKFNCTVCKKNIREAKELFF